MKQIRHGSLFDLTNLAASQRNVIWAAGLLTTHDMGATADGSNGWFSTAAEQEWQEYLEEESEIVNAEQEASQHTLDERELVTERGGICFGLYGSLWNNYYTLMYTVTMIWYYIYHDRRFWPHFHPNTQ